MSAEFTGLERCHVGSVMVVLVNPAANDVTWLLLYSLNFPPIAAMHF